MTANAHPMIIVSSIFLVSFVVVSARLDLRAFEDDAGLVPYAFGCRRGRCGGAPATNHRRWSGVRGLDRSIGEAGENSLGGDDYDHNGRLFDDEDRQMVTFPYCSAMSVDECRALVRHLERLRAHRPRRLDKQNVVGTVVRLVGRRRRAKRGVDSADEKATKTSTEDQQRAVRSQSNYAASDSASRLLDQYREWRKVNGYGRHSGRWGRSAPSAELAQARHHQYSGDASVDGDSVTTEKNGTTKTDIIRHRRPRSVIVEIEPEEQTDEQLPANERDMLDTYLAWRETHGYGTLAGRWG